MAIDIAQMAENLRVHRARADISQEKLAELANVSSLSIWKYENQKVVPTLETAARIADALGCSLDELVGRA